MVPMSRALAIHDCKTPQKLVRSQVVHNFGFDEVERMCKVSSRVKSATHTLHHMYLPICGFSQGHVRLVSISTYLYLFKYT